MPTAWVSKPGEGWAAIKKTDGQTSPGPAIGTQTFIPVKAVNPRNPLNIMRGDTISYAQSIVNATSGKHTPSVVVSAAAKTSWFTAAFLNSIIGGSSSYLDSNLDTDQYAVGMWEPVKNTVRVYDDIRFSTLAISYNAAGGDIMVTMSGPCLYGDSEKPSPTSFTTPTVDPGQNLNTSDVTITGATLGRSFGITIVRGQGPQPFSNQTLYMSNVSTGKIGGIFTVEQSDTALTFATSTITIAIGSVNFQFDLDLDESVLDFTTQFGTKYSNYAMSDLSAGTYPLTIS